MGNYFSITRNYKKNNLTFELLYIKCNMEEGIKAKERILEIENELINIEKIERNNKNKYHNYISNFYIN